MADLMTLLEPDNNEMYNEVIKRNLEKRVLIFNEDVTDSILENYIMYILKWNAEDKHIPAEQRKKIWIILNSPGGEKLAGMMFLDVIKQSKTPIYCLIVSLAASMASYIPMVSWKTYAFAHSVVCIHDGEVGVVQTTRKANDTMNFIKKCDERLDALVIENTKITPEFLDNIADREYYMFADEAKELGIIDYIIGTDCSIDDILN
jgi:ATP-dependent Clp protease protease subunit